MSTSNFAWMVVGAVVTWLLTVVYLHTIEPPVPAVVVDTVRVGGDYTAAHQRADSMYADCHEKLVEHQDRLRQLGHVYNEETGTWIKTR